MKKLVIIGAMLAGCSAIGGDSGGETYQHALRLLCLAPPSIMQNVLTTPALQAAWAVICAHTDSVPRTPPSQTVAVN